MRYQYITVEIDSSWREIIVSVPHFSWHVYHDPTPSSIARVRRYGEKYSNGKSESDGHRTLYHIIRAR